MHRFPLTLALFGAVVAVVSLSIRATGQDRARDRCLETAAAGASGATGDVLRDYVGGLDRDPSELPPLRASGLRRWLARRLGIPASALETLPARGRRGQGSWAVRARRTREGTTTYVRSEIESDECFTNWRAVVVHDQRGRLIRYRHADENCAGGAIEEDVMRRDAEGRIREATRTFYLHPIEVVGTEEQPLTDDLTLEDGTTPAMSDPTQRCTIEPTTSGTTSSVGTVGPRGST